AAPAAARSSCDQPAPPASRCGAAAARRRPRLDATAGGAGARRGSSCRTPRVEHARHVLRTETRRSRPGADRIDPARVRLCHHLADKDAANVRVEALPGTTRLL